MLINCTNKALVAYFLKHDIKPYDIFLGRNDTIVFTYERDKTAKIYEEWLHEGVASAENQLLAV